MAFSVTTVFKNLTPGLEIPEGDLVIFTGTNNSGKSALLQYLNIHSPICNSCDYVSPRRFDLSNSVSLALNSDNELKQMWSQRKNYNPEIAELTAPDPIRELVSLPDAERQRIVDWHNRYFGELKIESSRPDNTFAPPKITIDGKLATQQGSGSRAVLSVLCALLHPEREVVLIDEPEMGIEPQVQKRLADMIRKITEGTEGLPKKKVYIATHSHLFLDRRTLGNNYVVAKNAEGMATIRQVTTPVEFHGLVYQLLGNSPEDLFFPDNMLIVEGASDEIYWRRLLELSDCGGVAVHYSDGDGAVGAALSAIDQMLKTLAYIPLYKERLCVAVDSSVPDARINEWRQFLGDDGSRTKKLTRNGIEYFYPRSILAAVCGIEEATIETETDVFLQKFVQGARTATMGSFSGSKRDLARRVTERLTADHLTELSTEITDVLQRVRGGRFSNPTQNEGATT